LEAASAVKRGLQRQSTHSTHGATGAQHQLHQRIFEGTSIHPPWGALSVDVDHNFNALIEGMPEKLGKRAQERQNLNVPRKQSATPTIGKQQCSQQIPIAHAGSMYGNGRDGPRHWHGCVGRDLFAQQMRRMLH